MQEHPPLAAHADPRSHLAKGVDLGPPPSGNSFSVASQGETSDLRRIRQVQRGLQVFVANGLMSLVSAFLFVNVSGRGMRMRRDLRQFRIASFRQMDNVSSPPGRSARAVVCLLVVGRFPNSPPRRPRRCGPTAARSPLKQSRGRVLTKYLPVRRTRVRSGSLPTVARKTKASETRSFRGRKKPRSGRRWSFVSGAKEAAGTFRRQETSRVLLSF